MTVTYYNSLTRKSQFNEIGIYKLYCSQILFSATFNYISNNDLDKKRNLVLKPAYSRTNFTHSLAHTIQYNTIQYNTIRYSTIHYDAIQHNRIQ